jgi:spermidine/putrescine transport system substrate-binding protein
MDSTRRELLKLIGGAAVVGGAGWKMLRRPVAATNSLKYSDTMADNNAAEAAVRAGQADVVMPTFWMAKRLIQAGLVQPLPVSEMANRLNIDQRYLHAGWDPGCRFHQPWQAGLTGIAWRKSKFPEGFSTTSQFFEALQAVQGDRFALLSEMRDTVGFAMISQGQDPSNASQGRADRALGMIAKLKTTAPKMKILSNEYLDHLKSGRLDACMAWSGDMAQLADTTGDFGFAMPTDGGMLWYDCMVIPRDSNVSSGSGKFIDYFYDVDHAARLTSSIRYISPVVGAAKRAASAYKADEKLVSIQPNQKLFTWDGLSTAQEDTLADAFDKLV